MKYLLVLAVVWIAFLIWRARRRDEIAQRQQQQPKAGLPRTRTPGEPQAMLRCAHCGLHLPAVDALPGPDGQVYCCTAHRQAGPA